MIKVIQGSQSEAIKVIQGSGPPIISEASADQDVIINILREKPEELPPCLLHKLKRSSRERRFVLKCSFDFTQFLNFLMLVTDKSAAHNDTMWPFARVARTGTLYNLADFVLCPGPCITLLTWLCARDPV